MFSSMANTGKTEWWRFAITFVVVSTGFLAGQIPLITSLYARKTSLKMSDSDFEMHFNNSNLAAFDMHPNLLLIFIMIPFIIGFILLLVSIKYIHGRPVQTLFTGKKAFDWKKCWFGFGVWTVIAIPALVIMIPEENLTYQLEWNTFIPLFFLALLMVPIQTTLEESFFRGFLFQVLVRVFKGKLIPFLIIALGFALMHSSNPEFSEGFGRIIWAYMLLSFLFGILPLLDDGLELPIGIHAANNLIVVLFISAEGGALSTPAIFHTDLETLVSILPVLLPLVVVGTFIVLMLMYKWNLKTAFT